MPRPTLPAAALVLALATPSGAAEKVTELDRFRLWHECLPMDLVVEGLQKDADTELTEEAITVAVRSRLRAARLYKADALFSYLYVNVNVVPPAFSISIEFQKWLKDAVSGEEGFAATWRFGGTGTYRKGSGYILSGISQYADRFIDEYLRVNASACGTSK